MNAHLRHSKHYVRVSLALAILAALLAYTLASAAPTLPALNTSGLAAWWSLNETGGTRYDLHGTNHLTDNNTVHYAGGLKGWAGDFWRNEAEYLSIPDNASVSTNNATFTIIAHVYMNSAPANMVIVSKGANANGTNGEINLTYVANVQKFRLRIGNGTTLGQALSGVVTTNAWYTIVAWHDASAHTVNIQVNNGAVNSAPDNGGGVATTYPLTIGAFSGGTTAFDGRIDEVALYKRVLTADERTWLYNGGSARAYTDLAGLPTPTTFYSAGAYDGWILESSENSGFGGTLSSTAATLSVGDDPSNRQYRGLLSFNTSSLADNTVLTAVQVKIKKQGITGTDPFSSHGNLLMDIRNSAFNGSVVLETDDFSAPESKNAAEMFSPIGSGWYAANLSSSNFYYISLVGVTQFRLRFAMDDNNDFGQDTVRFFTGNKDISSYWPQLIVTYYIP